MELLKGIYAADIFLYIKKHSTLIISDLHAGYEENLNKEGFYIPKSFIEDFNYKLLKSISKIKKEGNTIKRIIINGDIVHSFSKVNRKEKAVLDKLLALIKEHGEISIIKGNHDKILSFLTDIEIVNDIIIGDILITHGDELSKQTSNKDINTIIIGHDHPAISLTQGVRSEKFKCFLKGKYRKKNLIVMPSSNVLIEGSDVLKEKLMSPYIGNIRDFEVYVIEDKIYNFGKIKNLMN